MSERKTKFKYRLNLFRSKIDYDRLYSALKFIEKRNWKIELYHLNVCISLYDIIAIIKVK